MKRVSAIHSQQPYGKRSFVRFLKRSVAALLCLTALESRALQPLNLLRNGNFEINWTSGQTGAPVFWRLVSTDNTPGTLVWTNDARTGGGAVYVQRNSTGGDTVLDNWLSMVPVTENMNYVYKFAAKGSGTLRVTTSWKDHTNGLVSSSATDYTLSGSYTPHTLSVTAPLHSAKAWIGFRVLAAGSFFTLDDVAMWADPGVEHYPTGYINLNQDNIPASNLTQIMTVGDGHTDAAIWMDKECRATRNDSTGHYMYFKVDDSFMKDLSGRACRVGITVEYADIGTDTFRIQYDSINGTTNYMSTVNITKTDTKEWKKTTFYIKDALFSNRQNGGADFRISDNANGKEYINYVAVWNWEGAYIEDSHLEINGTPTFLKTGWIGDNLQADLTDRVGKLVEKGYNSSSIGCFHKEMEITNATSGGAAFYRPLTQLNNFISTAAASGLVQCIDFQTENVGGVNAAKYLFDWYPNTQAYDSSGQPAVDSEYDSYAKIQSLFAPGYLNRSRNFMTYILKNIDLDKITFYETTVEPQYIGTLLLDYSVEAYNEWRYWLSWRYSLSTLNSLWSTTYTSYTQIAMPTNSASAQWDIWQTWRSYGLANWVNGDIQTIRNVVGERALVATDMLIANRMDNRMGNPTNFCNSVYPNVFQVNWTWHNNAPWDVGYDLMTPIAFEKNIALSEHMTFSGIFCPGIPDDADTLLMRTLSRGNAFGWYFINFRPITSSGGCLYNDDWTPKANIAVIDNNNAHYMNLARNYLLDRIVNSCFDDEPGILEGWRDYGAVAGTLNTNPANANSGKQSLRIERTGDLGADGGVDIWNNRCPVKPGEPLKFSIAGKKISGDANTRLFVLAHYYDVNGSRVTGGDETFWFNPGTTAYTTFTRDLAAVPANAATVNIVLRVGTAGGDRHIGAYQVDDVFLFTPF